MVTGVQEPAKVAMGLPNLSSPTVFHGWFGICGLRSRAPSLIGMYPAAMWAPPLGTCWALEAGSCQRTGDGLRSWWTLGAAAERGCPEVRLKEEEPRSLLFPMEF